MDDYFEKSKRKIISKIEDSKNLDELVIDCAIGVMGAFPIKEDGLKFMGTLYDKFLPPSALDKIMAKIKKEEE